MLFILAGVRFQGLVWCCSIACWTCAFLLHFWASWTALVPGYRFVRLAASLAATMLAAIRLSARAVPFQAMSKPVP